MVKALETYIVTNGNGRQAVDFYKDVFSSGFSEYDDMGRDGPQLS